MERSGLQAAAVAAVCPVNDCVPRAAPYTVVIVTGAVLLCLLTGLLIVYCVATWGSRGTPAAPAAPDPVSIAAGDVVGVRFTRIAGRNANLGAQTPEDVWDGGGDMPALPAVPALLQVASTLAADSPGNTGATSVTLSGVGWMAGTPVATLLEVTETLRLAGTTPVVSANAYLCVNSAVVTAAGAAAVNAGTITGTLESGEVAFQISPTMSCSLAARFLVPDGVTAFVTAWRAGLNQPPDGGRSVIFTLWTQPLGGAKTIVDWTAVHGAGTSVSDVALAPQRIPARSLVTVTASSTTVASDVFCAVDVTLRNTSNP